MNIIKEIGMPAMLEQLGEECCELGQAALKLSRKYRDENPTPKNLDNCINELGEEMADVMLCIEKIVDSGLVSHESIESWQLMKEARWSGRITEWKAEKTEDEIDEVYRCEQCACYNAELEYCSKHHMPCDPNDYCSKAE